MAETQATYAEIRALLNSYHGNTLYEMATAAGIPTTNSWGGRLRKTELISRMEDSYFDQARIRSDWEQLERRERAVLNRLRLQGGTVDTETFRRELLQTGSVSAPPEAHPRSRLKVPYASGYTGDPYRRRSTVFVDVVARLTLRGLVFSRDAGTNLSGNPLKLQFHPGATLFIPPFVSRYLPEPRPRPEDQPGWQPARIESGEPALFLRDLYLYWDYVRRNRVAMIQAGYVGKRSLRGINAVLLVPDGDLDAIRREDETGRLYLLRRLLELMGLVAVKAGELCPAGGGPLHIPPFWRGSTAAQLSACIQAWSSLTAPDPDAGDIDQFGPDYAKARTTVLEALRQLPAETWLELEDLVAKIEEIDTDFLFPEHSRVESYYGGWYYGYASGSFYGSPRDLLKSFREAESWFARRALAGLVFDLGLVELGYDDEQARGWQYFRITPQGKHTLAPPAQPPSAPAEAVGDGKLIIQPNFQIIAMGPVSLATLAQLDLFAERESADRGAFQYRLTRDAVYRAQQSGLEVSAVARFLEQNSAFELPQNVARSLKDWAAQMDRIVFRSGVTLLQAADGELLGRLLEDPKTAAHLARPVSEDMALVAPHRTRQLVSALLAAGRFPVVARGRAEDADGTVTLEPDGTIRSLYPVPSLYLKGRLARLASPVDGLTWRLAPDLVRRVAGGKREVVAVLEELEKLSRGPLPPKLVDQIKAWGGYYGGAGVERLTLMEFRDQSTLEELRAHPRLRALLTPFPAGKRALALVPPEGLEEVQHILQTLGVRVHSGVSR